MQVAERTKYARETQALSATTAAGITANSRSAPAQPLAEEDCEQQAGPVELGVVSIILGLHQLCPPAMAKNPTPRGPRYSREKRRENQYIDSIFSAVSASYTLLMKNKNVTLPNMFTPRLPQTSVLRTRLEENLA